MYRITIAAAAFMILASCSEAQTQSQDQPTAQTETQQQTVINKVVAPAEFKELMSKENIQIIDVRTPGEYSGGYIDNAVNIDFLGANFSDEISKVDKSKTTLIYCASGGRSGKAASMMKDLGFTEVYDLHGGYNGWPYK